MQAYSYYFSAGWRPRRLFLSAMLKRSQPGEIKMHGHIPVNYPASQARSGMRQENIQHLTPAQRAQTRTRSKRLFALFVRGSCVWECTGGTQSGRGVRHVFRRFQSLRSERYLLSGGYQFRRVRSGSQANLRFLALGCEFEGPGRGAAHRSGAEAARAAAYQTRKLKCTCACAPF